MFQFGKLVIQSTVATLPTSEIAAQAVVNTLEYFTSMPSMAVGLGLVTVAGQCMGAGRPQEAKRYSLELTGISELLVIGTGILIFFSVDTRIPAVGTEPGERANRPPDDGAHYAGEALYLAPGVYHAQRNAGGRRREIQHDRFGGVHVGVPSGAVHDPDPGLWFWRSGRLDRHVCGLV